eukprot:jgi/Undpi1/11629/HiC_scaffold_35.g13924.m1
MKRLLEEDKDMLDFEEDYLSRLTMTRKAKKARAQSEKDAGRLETIADVGTAADFVCVARDAGACVDMVEICILMSAMTVELHLALHASYIQRSDPLVLGLTAELFLTGCICTGPTRRVNGFGVKMEGGEYGIFGGERERKCGGKSRGILGRAMGAVGKGLAGGGMETDKRQGRKVRRQG